MVERILITGGSGFIGHHLVERWLRQRHEVTVLTRRPDWVKAQWPGVRAISRLGEASGHFDRLINLAGEGIADKRWSRARKQALLDSRVALTEELVAWARSTRQQFRVVMSGSATGYYGASERQHGAALTEKSPAGLDFAAQLCRQWEQAAQGFRQHTRHLVLLRTGVVMGADGGMLSRLWLPFKFGLGGRLGHGEQVLPWIHLQDYLNAVEYLVTSPVSGPVNLVAPNPVTNRVFTQALAQALQRPALLPMPGWTVRLLFGEMSLLLLQGQAVEPRVLQQSGFRFRHPDIGPALEAVVAER